ncbi:MAG: TRAP transporter small permease [Marinifilaceae bacterium]
MRTAIRKSIDKYLSASLIIIMAIMVIDVLWQVASRYLLGAPSSFTDEIATFLLIWVGILGGAYVYGQGEHLAIDIMLNKTSGKAKRQLQLFIECSVAAFALGVMCVGGCWLVYTRLILGVESAALQVNWGVVYAVIPLSGAMIVYYAIDNMFNLFKK